MAAPCRVVYECQLTSDHQHANKISDNTANYDPHSDFAIHYTYHRPNINIYIVTSPMSYVRKRYLLYIYNHT